MSQKLTQRKQQAMEMRSRIQAVALDLFDRESFANVSVEEIAQAAGCSVGNIYHYFKSKDELLIQVTDPALLEATGGIVQGMSGSPILQNGKLVGAVTHVLVNDPTRGYGIFIENMLDAAG